MWWGCRRDREVQVRGQPVDVISGTGSCASPLTSSTTTESIELDGDFEFRGSYQ